MARYTLKQARLALNLASTSPSPFSASAMVKERYLTLLHADDPVEDGRLRLHMPIAEEGNPHMHVELSPQHTDQHKPDVAAEAMSRQKFGRSALTIFNWAAAQNGYVHTPASYAMVIAKLCNAKMFASVWQVLDDMHMKEVKISSTIFETLIKGYIRAGHVKPAVDALDKIPNYGCLPTVEMYACVIGYVASVKRHHLSMLLYKRMKSEGLSANVPVFCALILGCCLVGQVHEAHQLLEEMKEAGVAPDEAIYNCLIETFSTSGKYYMAQMLLIEMRVTYRLAPSLVAYNSLIGALCKDHKVATAYKLFLDMRKAGVAPDVGTFNLILDGFFRLSGISMAIKTYKQMPRYKCVPSMETEKIMVGGFTRCGQVSRAISFLDSVVAAGREVDVIGCNQILHALCLKKIAKAEEFLDKMVHGICMPDAFSYTTLMHAYCKAGRLKDAERMFQMMKAKCCKPTSVSYEALIVAYCRMERLQAASELVDELIEEGYRMKVSTCNAMIDGLSRAGLVDHALKVIDHVVDNKLCVDPDKLVTFLRALHKVGRGQECKDVLKGMARNGCLQEPYASMF